MSEPTPEVRQSKGVLTDRERRIVLLCLGDEWEYEEDARAEGVTDAELEALIDKVEAL